MAPTSDPVDALILDLLEWIGPESRPYSEVIEAWRTSCPRRPVWEEATERGFSIKVPGSKAQPVFGIALGAQRITERRRLMEESAAETLTSWTISAVFVTARAHGEEICSLDVH
jgi:hypothetical protein